LYKNYTKNTHVECMKEEIKKMSGRTVVF